MHCISIYLDKITTNSHKNYVFYVENNIKQIATFVKNKIVIKT